MLTSSRPIVAMIVALLKVIWAITCTKVLSSARTSSKNLILPEKSGDFHFWEGWRPSVRLHATILVALYFVLLIALALLYVEKLGSFATALGVVTGIVSFWQIIWGVWKTGK